MLVSRIEIDVQRVRELVTGLETPDQAVEQVARNLVADIGEHWSAGVSAPGEAPGIDTGALANSIHAARLQPAVWAVRDGVEYGLALELGRMEINLAARPWMVPAIERGRGMMPGVFREVIGEIAE